MKDEDKTKDQLINELAELRQRITLLEKLENQRKRAEEVLRLKESVITSSINAIAIADLEGNLTYVNPSFLKLWGYDDDEEVLGKPHIEFVQMKEKAKVAVEALRDRGSWIGELIAKRKNGSLFDVLLSANMVTDEVGKPICMLASFIDITEHKRAEKALRESEGKLSTMLQSIGDHISMMDKDLNILWANETAKRIFGDDIIGKKCYEVYHRRKEPCEPHPCLTLKAFQDGEIHEHDSEVIGKNGEIIYFHCTANVALRDEEGNPTAVIEISRDMTKHKRAEKALKDSEEKLKNIFSSSPNAITVTDLTGNIVECNQATLDMHGYSLKEEVIGKNAFELIVKRDHKRARENMEKTLKQGSVKNVEYTFLTKDGREFSAELSASVIKDVSGNPVSFVAITKDITERKKAVEALRVKDSAITSSINAIAIADLEGNLTYVNPSFLKLWGYDDDEEVLGKPHVEFAQVEEGAETVVEALRARGSWIGELVAKRKNGSLFDVLLSANMVTDEVGKPICMLASFIDITEHKRAEEALREGESRFCLLAENVTDVIWTVDMSLCFTYFSPSVTRLLGYSVEEAMARTVEEILTPESFKAAMKVLAEELDREKMGQKDLFRSRTMEMELKRKDGSMVWAEMSMTFLHDQDGQPVGILGVARDITERKKAEKALRMAEQEKAAILCSMSEIVIYQDLEMRIIWANKAAAESVGLTIEQLVGSYCYEVWHQSTEPCVGCPVVEARKTSQPQQAEMTTPDGRVWSIRGYPVRDEKGKILGIVEVAEDITERKQAEEALKQRAEKLEKSKAELEQSLEELLERVEHEHEILVKLPVPAIDIEEKGATFLYPVNQEEEAYNLFRSKKDANRPALAITRTFPSRFHRKLGREVETVWLTSNRVPRMVCVDPADTMNLLLVLTEFFKRVPEGVVLFEGVDYIISIAGFKRFLSIIQLLNDKIATIDGTIYMILDLGVLEKKEARYILRECLPPPISSGAKEEN